MQNNLEKTIAIVEGDKVSSFILNKNTTIGMLKSKFVDFQIEMFLTKCQVTVFDTNKYDHMTFESLWNEMDNCKIVLYNLSLTPASTSRQVCSLNVFESKESKLWELAYTKTMEDKYRKLSRNFSKEIRGNPVENPQIYLIPRERGGASYKDVQLIGANSEDIFFAPVSKGYSMQDVSSFTLGPVIGEGLNIVNAAFSKSICIFHIEGGGCVEYKRKNF